MVKKKTKKDYPFDERELLEYLDFGLARADILGRNAQKFMKLYYEGSEVEQALINKLFGEINSIAALIYTPEKILIDIVRADGRSEETTPAQRKLFDALRQKLEHNFYTFFDLDIVTEVGVRDAIITGYTPCKVYWKDGGVKIKQIENGNFAVLYENIDLDDPQQIIVHRTFLTSQMVKQKYGIDIPVTVSIEGETVSKSSRGQIFVTAKEKAVADLTTPTSAETYYQPVSYRGLQEVYELWINEYGWTGKNLWHKFEILKFNRQIVKHEISTIGHPFFIIRPYVLSNSIYGFPILSLLEKIQEKRNQRLKDIETITELLLYPPLLITGATVSKDQIAEDVKMLWTPKGFLVLSDVNAHIAPSPPSINLDTAYAEIEFYDAQVRYITNLQEIVLGERAAGTRATGMATLLAQFAAAPFQRIAARLQAQLEEIFTYSAKLFQIHDKTPVKVDDKIYYFSELPEFRVEIKSASTSPIQLRTHIELAMELLKEGLFPVDIFLELIDMPFKDKVKQYIEEKLKAEMEAKIKEETKK